MTLRIALVGADGAGKSTISHMLESAELPWPVKRIYMGVNLEASTDLLPTTRLLFAAKRLRRRISGDDGRHRTQNARAAARAGPAGGSRRPAGPFSKGSLKDAARLVTWMTEEWLRQALAEVYARRGYIVVFDRHFFVDYHGSDELVRSAAPTSRLSTAHRWMLEHLYPKPDLVVCLDAPAEVLRARKCEDSIEWLEARRQQYLRLAEDVPAFVRVDVDRPLDEVFSDVLRVIVGHYDEQVKAA